MANIVFSEASGVADSIYGKSQAPIQEFILSTAKTREEAEAVYKRLFKMTKSTHYGEKYTGLTSMKGFAPTPENGANHRDGMQETFSKTLENIRWTNEFAISREMIDDSTIISLSERPQAFIDGYYDTRGDYCAAVFGGALSGKSKINYAGFECDITGADGLPLFHKDHPSVVNKAKKQSNICSNILSAESLDLVETAHQNFRDDNGKSMRIAPNTIVIPNTAKAKRIAFAAAGSERDPVSNNNAFNYQVGRWNICVWQELNDYVTVDGEMFPWFLMDEAYNEKYGTAILQDRTELEVNSYVDQSTHANIWTGYARFVAGFKDFRGVYAGGISGAPALA